MKTAKEILQHIGKIEIRIILDKINLVKGSTPEELLSEEQKELIAYYRNLLVMYRNL